MRRAVVSANSRSSRLELLLLAALLLPLAGAPTRARAADAPAKPAMQPLEDTELASVRGADGINFNLSNFSLTSDAVKPLTLTYQSPNGSSMTLSRLDLSRTDDPDGFADPYGLSLRQRTGLSDVIAVDFPLNAAGNQAWTLTADFANCDHMVAGTCTGLNFNGGTLKVSNLTMKGGGLTLAPTAIANADGIAFGLGTQLDIGSLAVYSHGRTAGDVTNTIDTSDSMMIQGIHLGAVGGGPWYMADVTTHPGLINAMTDSTGSYLHLQVGWPTAADASPAAHVAIDNITFTSPGVGGGAPVQTNLGAATIGSLQLNYVDIKLRTTP